MLGRETAIQRVEWTDDGWLRLTTGDTLPRMRPEPVEGPGRIELERVHDNFDGPAIDRRFSTLRRPWHKNWVFLDHDQKALGIRGGHALTSRFDVSLVATQLQDLDAVAETQVRIEPTHFSQSAGLTVFYDDKNFAYLRLYRSESLRSNALGIVLVENGIKQELLGDRAVTDSDAVVLQLRLHHGRLQFGWRTPGEENFHDIGPPIDASYLSDETTRGFTGTVVGITCVDSYRRELVARFGYFDLQHGISHLD